MEGTYQVTNEMICSQESPPTRGTSPTPVKKKAPGNPGYFGLSELARPKQALMSNFKTALVRIRYP